MTLLRFCVVAVILSSTLLAGCATAQAPAQAPLVTSAPPPTATAAPGTVMLTGALRNPGTITTEQLAALPSTTITVDYTSGKGAEQHTETGVQLSDVLPPPSLATTDRKNDLLAFAVLAVGTDGYTAVVSYGEISPDFGNRQLMLALTEDGTTLARPRLVVPGDVKGGRYVSDLVELKVVRVDTGS